MDCSPKLQQHHKRGQRDHVPSNSQVSNNISQQPTTQHNHHHEEKGETDSDVVKQSETSVRVARKNKNTCTSQGLVQLNCNKV